MDRAILVISIFFFEKVINNEFTQITIKKITGLDSDPKKYKGCY